MLLDKYIHSKGERAWAFVVGKLIYTIRLRYTTKGSANGLIKVGRV